MKTLLNIICRKKVKYSIFLLLLLLIYISISAIFYVSAVSSDLENAVFRLHVIANSDSTEDQNLKYKVRDNLLNYMNTIVIPNCKNKDDAINIINSHIDDFYRIAKQTIVDNGFDYNVSIEVGKYNFPTKEYGDISLPSGIYDALRVKIGDASGKNWWCVMFPPLCFVDVSSGIIPYESKEMLTNNLSEDEYSIISNNDSTISNFKFKIVEFLNNSNLLTAKK